MIRFQCVCGKNLEIENKYKSFCFCECGYVYKLEIGLQEIIRYSDHIKSDSDILGIVDKRIPLKDLIGEE